MKIKDLDKDIKSFEDYINELLKEIPDPFNKELFATTLPKKPHLTLIQGGKK